MMIRRIVLLFVVLIMGFSEVPAQQRYGFIDTEYILEKIPEYKAAQEQLDKLSVKWQSEIESVYQKVKSMKSKYQANQVFLSPEMRDKDKDAISALENQARKLQKKYFGLNGQLYIKRQELVKPIQDDIYEAVREIAQSGSYGMIIDKANGPVIIYSNLKYDLSDKVLHKLGYKK